MQVRVQVIAKVAVFFYQLTRRLINDKLLVEAVAARRFVVSIREVADGDALRPIAGPDPVGIGQVDADGRGRVLLTAKHRSLDDMRRDTFDLRLAETRIYRRMVFKPLCVLGDRPRALRGLLVSKLHDTLPGSFQAQWVAIDLNETIDEVDRSLLFLQPFNAVFVEDMKVPGRIIID